MTKNMKQDINLQFGSHNSALFIKLLLNRPFLIDTTITLMFQDCKYNLNKLKTNFN
jgi:hypothetical protein